MAPVKINSMLISTLPRVLKSTHAELAKKSNIQNATWYRIMKNPQSISIQHLLAMANGLHIPVRLFFSKGKTDIIGLRSDYVLESGYVDCYYDRDAILRVLGMGKAISLKMASEALGIHYSNVQEALVAERRVPLERLLTFCEAFNYDPFDFLIDRNPRPSAKKKASSVESAPPDLVEMIKASTANEFQKLHLEINKLKKKLETTGYEIAALRKANEQLQRQVNVNIDTISHSHLSIAAESEQSEYTADKDTHNPD